MPDFTPAGAAVLAAAGAAALVVLLTAWPWRKSRLARVGWVLGLAAGVYAGCAVLGLRPRWPAPEDRDRFLVVLLPLTLAVELTAALITRPRWPAWLLRIGVAAAAAPILLYNTVYLADLAGPHSAEWTPAQAALILSLLGTTLAATWAPLVLLQARTGDRSVPALLALCTTAGGVTVMLSGYFNGGLLGLPLAGALAGATAASYAGRGQGANCSPGVGVIGLFTVLLIGRFFGSLPTGSALCLMLTPLLAWVTEAPGVRKRRPWLRVVARLAVVAVPLVLVVADAKARFDEAAVSHYGSFEP